MVCDRALIFIGCYECSQRRIHCDNSHPVCNKCTVRGIGCSGYGVRYRFKTAVRVSEELGPTRESKYNQKSKAGHLVLASSTCLDALHPSEDSNPMLRNESCSTPTHSQVSESVATVLYHNEGFENNGADMTQSLSQCTEEDVGISRDVVLRSREPWKRYFLAYCEFCTEYWKYRPHYFSLRKYRCRNGGN